MYKIVVIVIPIMVLLGCDYKQQEKKIKDRSAQLDSIEQHLLLREKIVSLKEDSLRRLFAYNDSLARVDTITILPPQLIGEWATKMVCIETNCTGSAIGDVRNDRWTLTSVDSSVVINSSTNSTITRMYTGAYYANHTIKVSTGKEVNPHETSTIKIALSDIRDNKIRGNREVIQPDGCRILYSVEMDKK